MFSPEKNISSEKQIPCVNTAYHKSIGRTPLRTLTGQDNSLDERITRSYSKRLSGLTASLSRQTLKESSKSNTSTPVHVCDDSYPVVVLSDCTTWKANKLKPCSLSKCKFEKLNVVTPTENLDSNGLSIHSDKNPKLSDQVTLSPIHQLPDIEGKESAEASSEERSSHLAAEEGLTTFKSKTNAHRIADIDSSALVAQESCVPGTENVFNVRRVRPVMEIRCSMQKDEHNASGSYTKEGTPEHKDCYSLLSEDLLRSSFNNQPIMSAGDASWHSPSGETSPVQLCPSQSINECLSVGEEFELIGKLDNMMASTINDPYLNVTQRVVEQASPSVVASVLHSEREAGRAVINEELSLLESTIGVLHETYDLQDLLKSDGADLDDIFTQCLPAFFPVNQTDCPLDTGEIPKEEMTKYAYPSNSVPSVSSDQSNCTYFLAIGNSTAHSLSESVDENLPSENSVLQSEKLISDVYINETANDCTSFIEGEVEDAVSSTESPTKKQPTHHHDYISAVSEALTPFLCRTVHPNGPLSHSVCQTHGVASMTPLMQLHPTMLGSPMSCESKDSKNIQSVGNSPLECGTCITPISHSSAATWITPIMLLNKSINTLQDSKGRDTASETDCLSWTFSQESLRDASREELISRLEGSLIVVQVLSHQLQEWQKDVGSSRPSEQRDTSSQTVVSYVSTDEQYYHNLYMQALERLQAMQRTHEEEQHLLQVLRKAMEALESHKTQSSSMTEFTEKLHNMMKYDKIDLLSQSRVLAADQTALLSQVPEKMQCNLLQMDEIKAQLENALCAKEETDQSLKDLKIHYSRVLAKLRRDLESEKRLGATVKKAYEQQRSTNNNYVQFAHMFQSVSKEVEDDRTHLQLQCTDAKELMSQYNRLFEVMKEKTQTALQDHETLKCERDSDYFENKELCNRVDDLTSQNDRLKTETSRLTSELTSLMKHACDVKSEADQLRQDKSELEEELCAKSSSLKLLEKELNKATARALVFQDRNRELTGGIVPRLEQELWEAEEHYEAMKKQLIDSETQHASQIAMYTESIEFLEQENCMSREHVSDIKSQLKASLDALRERNLQCENEKDKVAELQKEINELQEELDSTKNEAQKMLQKMDEERSVSSVEVDGIKENLKKLTERLQNTIHGEVLESSCLRTPAQKRSDSSVGSALKTPLGEESTVFETKNVTSIGSETSAFSVVRPVASPTACDSEKPLPDVLRELSVSVCGLANSSAEVIDAKQQLIKDLSRELFLLKEELQRKECQYKSDLRDLKEDLEKLERKNQSLNECLNRKQQCIRELENLVDKQEQKILQQIRKEKKQEEIFEENNALKRSLQLSEYEVNILREEMVKNPTCAARDWVQEKLMLHNDLTKLRQMLIDSETTKSDIVHRSLNHRDIMERNLAHSERELRKLDDLIETIRETLMSIPDVVSSNQKLSQIMGYLK